jgi:hypothetical protein
MGRIASKLGENRNDTKFWSGNNKGKKPLGRPRHRWGIKDKNIKLSL